MKTGFYHQAKIKSIYLYKRAKIILSYVRLSKVVNQCNNAVNLYKNKLIIVLMMKNLRRADEIQKYTGDFLVKTHKHHRYRSFDFCYSHFYFSKLENKIDIETSCYVLWSYLASWGMLRGSSFMLQKNPSYLSELVEYIYKQDIYVWQIDVESYSEENMGLIIKIYEDIRELIIKNNEQDLVLITKILLGVFAITPAYDTYFCKTFRNFSNCKLRVFNKKSLKLIKDFYLSNKDIIDDFREQSTIYDFNNNPTTLKYKQVKIIDMYGFEKSFSES